ncbi:hypothetical protein DPMN_128069 [Dreissena polymorpha]|uniref:Receptor ligand binding region domain-containing protein n=1 Tax=Dreissena polymorpha TaxID=45954 RepID=A0A9D4JZS9_DREPO|nr:hypothetical protein DPMN_128069 [Dreissena polymorpha]
MARLRISRAEKDAREDTVAGLQKQLNVLHTANTSPDLPQLRKHNITFDFIMADTHCDIGQGLYQLVEMNPHVNAYIGPACDAVCLPAGLLAAKWDKPMISYSCSSRTLNNHAAYKTFARTTAIYVDMLNFLVDILHHFKWDRVTLVEGSDSLWHETAGYFQEGLEAENINTESIIISSEETHESLQKRFVRSSKDARIFILCAYGLDVYHTMCAAESAGLLDGDHAFIAIDFAHLTNSAQTGRPCRMNKALEGLLDITIRLDEDYAGYQEFVHELNRRTNVIHGAEVGIHMGMVYDAVFLYATGLDEAIEQGFTVHNGSKIIRQLLTRSFQVDVVVDDDDGGGSDSGDDDDDDDEEEE